MKATFKNARPDPLAPEGEQMQSDTFDPITTPYSVRESDFPQRGSLEEQLVFLLRYVTLAPSTHNTQPWKFALIPGGIELYADYTRRMPVVDPGHRELLMSIGAAVFTLRVAADRFGFDCRVAYNYSGDSERPLATAMLTARGGPPGDAEKLFASIVRRHTNRSPFLLSRLPESILLRIRALESVGGASLWVSTDGALNSQVGDLVAAAEQLQLADPAYRRGLAEWIRPNQTLAADGVSGAALGLNAAASALEPWSSRVLDAGRKKAASDKNLCAEAPGLVVVQSEDSVPHWLSSGEILQHLLLKATGEGLHHSYFNMPVQVPDLRVRLRKLLGLASWPQLLLRIGFSLTEAPPSPRRPLDEMIFSTMIR
ncbi:MAG TPA: nitroreductase [Bacteroidota bacterium]|nr:nitroreductase [Bacteroidota bacterium]